MQKGFHHTDQYTVSTFRRKSQESSKASTGKDNNVLQNEASNIMYNSACEDVANGAPNERSTEYESVILPSGDKTTLVDELKNDDKVQEDVYGNQESKYYKRVLKGDGGRRVISPHFPA